MNKINAVIVNDLIKNQVVYSHNISTPLISIIMPCYTKRNGKTQRAINSVLNQTLNNFELIIVDDGSIDGLKDDLLAQFERDKRIVYIRNEINSGLPALRVNQGIEISRGEYVSYMFEDDIFLPDALLTLYENIVNKPDICLVYGKAGIIDDNYTTEDYENIEHWLGDKQYQFQDFVAGNKIANCSVMHHKQIFEEIGLFDPHIIAVRLSDWDLWVRALRKFRFYFCLKTIALATVGSHYSIGNNSNINFIEIWCYLNKNRNLLLKKENIKNYDVLSVTMIGNDLNYYFTHYYTDFISRHPKIIKSHLWMDYFCHINTDRGIIIKADYDTSLDPTINNYRDYIPNCFFITEQVFAASYHTGDFNYLLLSRTMTNETKNYLESLHKKTKSKYSIYFIDDDLFNFGEGYYKKDFPYLVKGSETYTNMCKCIEYSGAVSAFSYNIYMTCNSINKFTFQTTSTIHQSYIYNQNYNLPQNTIIIGMASSSFREAELKALLPQLQQLAKEFSNKIEFIFMGAFIEELNNLPCKVNHYEFDYVYERYITKLKQSKINFFISPLSDDHIAKKAKSPIKFLEAIACGAIPVLSDVVAYSEMTHNLNCIKSKDTEWYKTIKKLILCDQDKLGNIFNEGKKFILSKYSVSQNSLNFLNILNVSKIRQLSEKPDKMIKIAFFIHEKWLGGATLYLFKLALALSRFNFQILIIFPKSSITIPNNIFEDYNFPIFYLDFNTYTETDNTLVHNSELTTIIQDFLRSHAIDIVHCVTYCSEVIQAANNLKKLNISTLFGTFSQPVLKSNLPRPSIILSDSNKFGSIWAKILNTPYIKICQPVNNEFFEMKKDKTKFQNKIKFLMSGTIQDRKNQLLALNVISILKNKKNNIMIDFIGYTQLNNKYYQECLRYINENNLDHVVRFHDYVENPTTFYKNADIFLSLSDHESLPGALLHALASQVLVITSDVGGIKEVIKNGFNGFIIYDLSPLSIANTIVNILNLSQETINSILESGKLTATYIASEKIFIHKVLHLYANITQNSTIFEERIDHKLFEGYGNIMPECKQITHITIQSKIKTLAKSIYYILFFKKITKRYIQNNLLLLEMHIATDIYASFNKKRDRLINLDKINKKVLNLNGNQKEIFLFITTKSTSIGKIVIEISNSNNEIIEEIVIYNCDCDFSRPLRMSLKKSSKYSGKTIVNISSFGNVSQVYILSSKVNKKYEPFLYFQ